MWINPQTLQVFYSHSEIRAAFPSVSFPSVMSEDDIAFVGVKPVTKTPQPAFNPATHAVRETAPAGGVQQWEVYALPAEEATANQAAAAQVLQQSIVDATQQRLDDFARTRNYDGILSLCTYATSAVPKFRAEGQYGVEARDATWAALYQIMAEVEAGTRPAPSGYADIEPELPVLEWPA